MAVVTAARAVKPEPVLRAVELTGMRAEVWREAKHAADRQTFWKRRGWTVVTLASRMFTLVGVAVHDVWGELAGSAPAVVRL